MRRIASSAFHFRWAIWSGVLLLLALPARAQAQEDDDRAQDRPVVAQPRDRPVEVSAELLVGYSSNPYHEQSRRLDDFDSKNDPGERYEDMEGPSDLFARPALGVEWSHKIAAKRRLALSAGAEFTAFAKNTLASYAELEAGARVDLTRRDRIGLEIDFIPRRFKKNYYDDIGGAKVFDRAYYLEVAPALSYRRDWTKKWATELEYELALRRFDDPFEHRDSVKHTVTLLVARELSQRFTIAAGPLVSVTRVDDHMEFAAEVDRSHTDVGVLGVVEMNLAHRWAAEIQLEYKHKSYGSDDPADDAHYERDDNVVSAGAEVSKGLGRLWSVVAVLELARSTSDRTDPTVDADEYGYTEVVLAIGGQATF